MAIARVAAVLLPILFGLGMFSLPAISKPKASSKGKPAAAVIVDDLADTMIFSGSIAAERLVLLEAKQQKRRMTTVIPVGSFRTSFSLILAQKNLVSKDQIHSGPSGFLTTVAEFSSARLAVYADANPCVNDQANSGGEKKQPTMSVAGVPYFKETVGATVTFEFAEPKAKSWPGTVRGLSASERGLAKKLAALGYGFIKATYIPAAKSNAKDNSGSKDPGMMPALQIAWESEGSSQSSQIIGRSGFLVERFFFGVSGTELVQDNQTASFPSGVELPYEAAELFPLIYRDWRSAVLKQGQAIKAYVGPVNRCDLCYERPPSKEVLSAAGVFWNPSVEPVNKAALRAKQAAQSAADTWLSRHLFQKASQKNLSVRTSDAAASIGLAFTEQGSVQKPFLGEIFCPAMEGYQTKLTERREKTMAALNGMQGMSDWNEKKLTVKSEEAGVLRPSWYQDHWQK